MRRTSALQKCVRKQGIMTFMALSLTVAACSGRIHEVPKTDDGKIPISIRVVEIDQVPFGAATRASDAGDVCKRITYAIYQGTGEKPDKIQRDQLKTDASFGTLNISLEEGDYTLVVIAHNGDGNPTMTTPTKITFNNKSAGKVTDTFAYCAPLSVAKGMAPVNVQLERAVAKLELKLTDSAIPEQVSKFQFEVTGVSQSYNVFTGWGLNSTKVSESFNVMPVDSVYEMYMFPREGYSTMNVTVSALDSLGQEYKKISVSSVPVTKNRITRCTGEMFKKQILDAAVSVSIGNEWEGVHSQLF